MDEEKQKRKFNWTALLVWSAVLYPLAYACHASGG